MARGVAGLRGDEAGDPVGSVRGGVMRNIVPDHGLKGPQLVQGQGVCHEAVGKNRDELDVHQENVFRKGELEGLEGCEK